jgi:hypothetical protein
MKRIKSFIATYVVLLIVASSAPAYSKTFCQRSGHGAQGCKLQDQSEGFCWTHPRSPTGYVCREDKPVQARTGQQPGPQRPTAAPTKRR